MLVRDLMTPNVPIASRGDTIAEAAQTMMERNCGVLVVVDAGRVEGIFSERDVVRCVSGRVDAARERVRDHMTLGVATVAPDDDARTAIHVMVERDLRHVPVVEKTLPVGLISVIDVLRAFESGGRDGLGEQEIISIEHDAREPRPL
jgi:CBS domain-containing protein